MEKLDGAGNSLEWLPTIRSSLITIPQFMVDEQGHPLFDDNGRALIDQNGSPRKGHSLDLEVGENSIKVLASYLLHSNRDASAMKIDLVNPDLKTITTLAGNTTREHPFIHLDLHTFTEADPDGSHKGLFIATDAHKEQYRDHKNRPAIAVNDTTRPPTADNYHWLTTYQMGGDTTWYNSLDRYHIDEIAANFQKKVAHTSDVLTPGANDTYTADYHLYAGYIARANGQAGLIPAKKGGSAILTTPGPFGNHSRYNPHTLVGSDGPLSDGTFQRAQRTALFLKRLPSDALAFTFSHAYLEGVTGAGGILNPGNNYLLAGRYSYSSPTNHNNVSLFVEDVRTQANLVVYLACDSAATDATGHGNLLVETCNSGARMALGFELAINAGEKNSRMPIYWDYPKVWATQFWKVITRGTNDTPGFYNPLSIRDAMASAMQAVRDESPDYQSAGYESAYLYASGGNGDVLLDSTNR